MTIQPIIDVVNIKYSMVANEGSYIYPANLDQFEAFIF
jgi:hypothetical protein